VKKSTKRRKSSSDKGQLEFIRPPKKKTVSWAAVTADLPEEEFDDGFPQRSWADRAYNTLIGLALLPFAWILTSSLVEVFSQAKITHGGVPVWLTHEFIMFGLGAALWIGWFLFSLWHWGEPRPLRVYVWGHEMMHAIWAKFFGGKIKEFEGWNREGGYIVTDKYNFWIALVPYLYPFYSVPVMAAWGIGICFFDVWNYREWFLGLLGFTWMFHLSFTIWMMPKGQTDFLGPGRLFSFVWIYLINISLIAGFLLSLAPEVSLSDFLQTCVNQTFQFYQNVIKAFQWCIHLL